MAALKGWYAAGSAWVKVACNSAGELLLAAAALFENPPTDGEESKGPSSNWAYDHAANASAHHAKYTDGEARMSFGQSVLTLTAGTYTAQSVSNIGIIYLDSSAGNINLHGLSNGAYGQVIFCVKRSSAGRVYIFNQSGSAAAADQILCASNSNENLEPAAFSCFYIIYLNSRWVVDRNLINRTYQLFDASPVNGQIYKGPNSDWAYDHAANTAAHHARYTDGEARAACGLDGVLYWSAPGAAFRTTQPDVINVHVDLTIGSIIADQDNVEFFMPVNLPDGAVVTGAEVRGNAGAQAESWSLLKVPWDGSGVQTMATAAIDTEDTTISQATIDNSANGYMIKTTSLDTNDAVYSVRINFTV